MKNHELFIIWLIACIATVASLFFSKVAHAEPCNLCWYQRVLLFPLSVILGIAAFRNAYRIVLYVLPLTLLGMLVAGYHFLLMTFFSKSSFCPTCVVGGSFSKIITFPLLSFLTFFVLSLLLIIAYFRHRRSKKL